MGRNVETASVHHCLNRAAPQYLSELIQPLSDSRLTHVVDYVLHSSGAAVRIAQPLATVLPSLVRSTCLEQSSSRSAPILDIFYFQNAPEVTFLQHTIPFSFSLTISPFFLYRALEDACAAYASLKLSLFHYINVKNCSLDTS